MVNFMWHLTGPWYSDIGQTLFWMCSVKVFCQMMLTFKSLDFEESKLCATIRVGLAQSVEGLHSPKINLLQEILLVDSL